MLVVLECQGSPSRLLLMLVMYENLCVIARYLSSAHAEARVDSRRPP